MYSLGKQSRKNLNGVDDTLVYIVEQAITLTVQDFSVHQGLRTLSEQEEYVRKGVSFTMNSKHLTGQAVDLVPYIGGQLRWEWIPIYKIAEAVRAAAKLNHNTPIRWGGAWDINFTETEGPAYKIVRSYIERRKKANKRIFLDGPHFELIEV